MNIVILGAGTVGTSIAEVLCATQHNVCLVDSSRDALNRVEEQLDVRTVNGSACDAVALFQAGISSADLCLGLSSTDEVNLVGCSIAKSMGATRSIARVFDHNFLDNSTFDYRRHFQIDQILSLEHLTALELARSIRMQRLFAVENFVRGSVEVQELAVEPHSKAVGVPLKELNLPQGVRVGLISNAESAYIPGANDVIHAGEHVTLIGETDRLEEIKKLFEHRSPPKLNVTIAGGGEIGYSLARLLTRGRFQVTLLEANPERCVYLADKLESVTVLQADIARRAELEEARVGKTDIFIAATGRDEDNIICGVEARELGCQKIMSVVRRSDYVNVLGKVGIDFAVSPREVMARQILGLVETGPLIGQSDICGGEAVVCELEVQKGVPITLKPLSEISLPSGLVVAIEREGYVKVPGARDQLQAGDIAVVLTQKENRDETLAFFR
ncbi:Trk system potassium uptake protein TrkA [Polystyrenella longa]|uniref:Trk system potassium uptake protein TrkA n=1 Tax=Polystyrenella longa TaxID=2528007 RepID=A0A518CIE5_9PLAN|nr:Trk system potassium transporter TrkA [Polystyrenella longa]QDU79013.1 Trk system potassium uptake protein TrkA [Polystyrenella longa]